MIAYPLNIPFRSQVQTCFVMRAPDVFHSDPTSLFLKMPVSASRPRRATRYPVGAITGTKNRRFRAPATRGPSPQAKPLKLLVLTQRRSKDQRQVCQLEEAGNLEPATCKAGAAVPGILPYELVAANATKGESVFAPLYGVIALANIGCPSTR